MEKKLKDLLIGIDGVSAPRNREYVSEHIEFIVGIGEDESATITMSVEAFEKLKEMTLDYTEKET